MGFRIECDKAERYFRNLMTRDIAGSVVRRLIARGMNIAKPLAQAASPSVGQSIVADPIETNGAVATGSFGTNADIAPYIEFGTGRPGKNGEVKNGQPRNPAAAGFGYTLQTVIKSGRRKGQIRQGWVYYDGRFHHTFGQAAKPFMYPAQLQLEKEAAEIAGVTVRDNIAR